MKKKKCCPTCKEAGRTSDVCASNGMYCHTCFHMMMMGVYPGKKIHVPKEQKRGRSANE